MAIVCGPTFLHACTIMTFHKWFVIFANQHLLRTCQALCIPPQYRDSRMSENAYGTPWVFSSKFSAGSCSKTPARDGGPSAPLGFMSDGSNTVCTSINPSGFKGVPNRSMVDLLTSRSAPASRAVIEYLCWTSVAIFNVFRRFLLSGKGG